MAIPKAVFSDQGKVLILEDGRASRRKLQKQWVSTAGENPILLCTVCAAWDAWLFGCFFHPLDVKLTTGNIWCQVAQTPLRT